MRRFALPAALALVLASSAAVLAVEPATAVPGARDSLTSEGETTAKITDIDRDTGEVEVELANGNDLTLRLPPSALGGFHKGDPVRISSRISMSEMPNQAIPRADDAD